MAENQTPKKESSPHGDRVVIGYAGTLMAHRPVEKADPWWKKITQWFWTYRVHLVDQGTRSGYYLFRGLQIFQKKYPELKDHLLINLWGLIHEDNAAQVREFGIDDLVLIEGYFDKGKSLEKLKACDLFLLPLEAPHQGQKSFYIPGKVFDYLRFGKPVFCPGRDCDAVDILKRSGLGLIVDPYDTEAMADAFAELVRNRATIADDYQVDAQYVEENFHFRNLTKELIDVFEEVLD